MSVAVITPLRFIPTEKVYTMDCFDREASRASFAAAYDIGTLSVGGGTNVLNTRSSYNTLTTGGILNNQEGTRITDPIALRAREQYASIMVDLAQIADTEFRFGFWVAANELVYIEFDKSVNDNWRLTVDDTTGAQYGTTVFGPVTATMYFLRLWVDSDGTPHWAVDTIIGTITELSIAGVTKKMTANPHYIQYLVKTEAGAQKIAEVDYLETEKNK